jgi:hypothetical protein
MSRISVEPEKLRPQLHQQIDQMQPDQLELLHRVMLKLELEQTVEQLHHDFDGARAEGKLERADEIIQQVRAGTPYA